MQIESFSVTTTLFFVCSLFMSADLGGGPGFQGLYSLKAPLPRFLHIGIQYNPAVLNKPFQQGN